MVKIKKVLRNTYLIWVMVLFVAIFSILSRGFFTVDNLINILSQNSYMLIVALGVGIVHISGGADLSVSYQMGIVSVVVARLMKHAEIAPALAIIIGLMLGLLLGFVNGYFVVKIGIHPIIITMATQQMFRGIAYIIAGSRTFSGFSSGFTSISRLSIGPVPTSVIIAIAAALTAYIIMNRTYLGRYIYAIGGNPEAARRAGINNRAIKRLVFVISGFFVSVAAIVVTARSGAAEAEIAKDAAFSCMTACVLGGVSFRGGSGHILNTCVGVLIIGVLSNGLLLIGVGIYYRYIAEGIILAAAIAWDTYRRNVNVK